MYISEQIRWKWRPNGDINWVLCDFEGKGRGAKGVGLGRRGGVPSFGPPEPILGRA